MNIRRIAAALTAGSALALGAGTTVFASAAPSSTNPHHRHHCAVTTPGTVPGHKCVQDPKPTHTPKPHPTHTPKPHPTHTPKPHPTHTPRP
ncbi:MAG TPA: hypothetical protein VH134_16245 [Candidatus Dormibacteraeota bacterium]|nr:hypothetical protein [Candidatus Dormibacteraeota bacterium]